MPALAVIFKFAELAYGAVKIGKILWNLPTLYRFGKHFGPIAAELVKQHRLPNNAESVDFLNATADLLRANIVDFPGVDEAAIAGKIDEFVSEFKKAA